MTGTDKPLFICGAGISRDAPASLPLTRDIVEIACRWLLPDRTPTEQRYGELIRGMQPEVLFEQASLLVGDRLNCVWDVLRRADVKPNINHYLLVTLASHFRVPIITLNFDTLLEEAANQCGLDPKTYVPGRPDLTALLTSRDTAKGKCVIWKVHGSLDVPDSLQTNMSQLARPNTRLLQVLKNLASRCGIYIVGYSGRDGDFFPELASILEAQGPESARPQWIDPYWNHDLAEKAQILRASAHTDRLAAVIDRDFPWCHDEIRRTARGADPVVLRELSDSPATQQASWQWQSPFDGTGANILSDTLREALLMCLLLQSGNTKEAYIYGADRIKRFQQELPTKIAAIVTLYFARLCDWNSQYDDFLYFSQVSRQLAKRITSKEERRSRLFVETASECLSTRARWMIQGPTMTWPDRILSFRWDRKQELDLFYACVRTSFRLRKSLAGFSSHRLGAIWRIVHPTIPSSFSRSSQVFEVLAWQYYLDHSQVFLNHLMRFLLKWTNWRPRGRLSGCAAWFTRLVGRACARLALWRLTWLVRAVGAAYTRADIYLFRSRYGIADDFVFAEHFWTLVGHPVGRALIFRDRGLRFMRAHDHVGAAREFARCYRLSASCGSHLTALKALIGLFYSGKRVSLGLWECHVSKLQGERFVSFFSRATDYLKGTGAFR